jgi:hypothetical protein
MRAARVTGLTATLAEAHAAEAMPLSTLDQVSPVP